MFVPSFALVILIVTTSRTTNVGRGPAIRRTSSSKYEYGDDYLLVIFYYFQYLPFITVDHCCVFFCVFLQYLHTRLSNVVQRSQSWFAYHYVLQFVVQTVIISSNIREWNRFWVFSCEEIFKFTCICLHVCLLHQLFCNYQSIRITLGIPTLHIITSYTYILWLHSYA